MSFKRQVFYWLFIIATVNFFTKLCRSVDPNADFDNLILSQQWPLAECKDWTIRLETNECDMPPKDDIWTIHGLWPNKLDKSNVEFCQRSPRLKMEEMQPLKDLLEKYWPNVHKTNRKSSLWEYEYNKHGSCATQLDGTSTPYKYFEKTLSLYDQYAVQKILSNSKIQPGSEYDAKEIHEAIYSNLKANAKVKYSQAKGSNGEQYLHEIRICFNKQFELIDCMPDNMNGRTSCDWKKKIVYLSKMPEGSGDESTAWKFMVHFLSIIVLVVIVLFAYKWAKSRMDS